MRERVICYPLLFTARHDHGLCALVVTGAVALRQIAPWVNWVTTFTGLTFTTTVRVVNRVHDRTANGRTNTHPTLHTGLAQTAHRYGNATLLAREGIYAQVRMRSGEVRKVHIECRATIGEVANEEHSLRRLGKAGVKRWMGIRPTVRGVVMNPVDHPHGGGEGKTGEGRHAVDPWGNLTKGYRTRNNKRTQSMIVSRRKK